MFPLGAVRGGHSAPSVNLGPLISRKLLELKVQILHTFRRGQVLFSGINIFPPGSVRGCSAASVNFGPVISRKLLELES